MAAANAVIANIFIGEVNAKNSITPRIACNLLDLETGKCGNYSERLTLKPSAPNSTKKNLPDFHWLPDTCAYRLLYEGKTLPKWHPLISGPPIL